MYISYTLAQILGLYLFIMGVAMLINPNKFKVVIKEFQQNHPLIIYSGVVSLILGIILIRIHNYWVAGWPIVITIVGWLVFLKALYRLFLLEKFIDFSKKILSREGYSWICWINILLGAYLMMMGFFG